MMFSIIVPNYNNGAWLSRCFESIAKQRRKDYEVIFIDDVSTDNSYDIYEEWTDRLPATYGIKLSEKRYNGGARNVGLKYRHGLYTLFLDSDDCLADETCLDRIGDVIKDNDYPDLIRLSYLVCKDGEEWPADLSAQDTTEKILASNSVACWTKCVKSDKVVRFPENTLMEDVVQHLAQLDVVDTVAACKGPIIKWNRDNANSCSTNMELQGGKWRSSLYRFYADLLDLKVNRDVTKFELLKRQSMALDNIRNERFEQ